MRAALAAAVAVSVAPALLVGCAPMRTTESPRPPCRPPSGEATLALEGRWSFETGPFKGISGLDFERDGRFVRRSPYRRQVQGRWRSTAPGIVVIEAHRPAGLVGIDTYRFSRAEAGLTLRRLEAKGSDYPGEVTVTMGWVATAARLPLLVPATDDASLAALAEAEDAERERVNARLLSGKDGHDGAIWLIEHGDESSIPGLMRILGQTAPPKGSDAAVCTYGHAADALRAITLVGEGWTYAEWRAWYEEYLRQHPEG